MKEILKLIAFILLITGTAGLLINEFTFDMGRVATIVFASCNVIGLFILIVTYFTKRYREKEQENR